MIGYVGPKHSWAPLTRKQAAVARFLCYGTSRQAGAARMQISIRTWDCHRAAICRKLEVSDTCGILRCAMINGWITIDELRDATAAERDAELGDLLDAGQRARLAFEAHS